MTNNESVLSVYFRLTSAVLLMAWLVSYSAAFSLISNIRRGVYTTCEKSSCGRVPSSIFVERSRRRRNVLTLSSSFYGRDEDEDEDEDGDDDDDDDDDYDDDIDDATLDAFRNRMNSLFGDDNENEDEDEDENEDDNDDEDDKVKESSETLSSEGISSVDELISFARSQQGGGSPSEKEPKEWASPAATLEPGVILLANPAKFCSNFGTDPFSRSTPSPTLLAKFGLTLPPPADLGPDRRADLLPVLILVEKNNQMGTRAVLLNRRTGYLLGDLEQPPGTATNTGPPGSTVGSTNQPQPSPILEKFCIQPLWFGGVDNVSSGLDMLHMCPAVIGAKQLTEDGLFWGGDPAQAQDAMSDSSLDKLMTGFDFKFFVQSTLWSPQQLEKEIEEGVWVVASLSKEVLFKSRDRMGTRRAKPLWTEVMELLGNEYTDLKNKLYGD